MRKIRYVLCDPTGNRTVIVRTSVTAEHRGAVAAALMAAEPTAEQVGFLRGTSLTMAGGEFCGNATMAAAALCCREQGTVFGESRRLALTVSGVTAPVTVDITAMADGEMQGRVAMPGSFRVEYREIAGLSGALPVVTCSGITHVILEKPIDAAVAEAIIRPLCRQWKAPALGLLLLDLSRQQMRPLVYVPGADTLFWENSCASGTAAVGIWLAQKDGMPRQVTLQQPGGVLTAEVKQRNLWITGRVRFLQENSMQMSV